MTVKTYDTFGDDVEDRSNLENECSCEKKAIFALLICAIIALGFVLVEYYEDTTFAPAAQNKSWDYLLFTQQWPISYCTAYTEEKKEPITECNFADNEYAWSIHGIWPSISNSSDYPQFCGRLPFNVTEIEPIKDQLLKHWGTIQKDTKLTYLWKHEWLKHGTCAAQIELLDSELKYFSQGLKWNQQYNITDVLMKCGIYADDAILYTNDQVIDCVKQRFDAEPQIYCMFDNVRNQLLLTEVRLCFDKNLTLRSCDSMDASLRCDKDFIYPGTVTKS